MNGILIEGSKATPRVEFDMNKLSITGQSYPENAMQFYAPVFDWLNDYLQHLARDQEAVIEFNLLYMNTSSSKCIMDIIDMLEFAFNDGQQVRINWYYDQDNEGLLECAEEFKEDVSFPFNIIAVEI